MSMSAFRGLGDSRIRLGVKRITLRRSNTLNSGMQQKSRVRRSVTGREHEVLSWIAKGKANKDIAQILCISPRTVQKHLETIFKKLGVENRTCAALRYLEINEMRKSIDY